ncbi:hypothetical protein CPB86DRAFT_801841 [Serendipita vermifera]|nr:hypothetical protein CPB86DRAFT_801841 [Serendipita vermifera]
MLVLRGELPPARDIGKVDVKLLIRNCPIAMSILFVKGGVKPSKVLILKDTTIELSTREDVFLKDIEYLLLEVSIDGQVVTKANLLSGEWNPWVWEADEVVVMPEVAIDVRISVVMEAYGDERQMVAFVDLNGSKLSNALGNRCEIPLMSYESYPNLVLKTRPTAIETVDESLARSGPSYTPGYSGPPGAATIEKMLADAHVSRQEFEQHRIVDHLDQAISQYRTAIEHISPDDQLLPGALDRLVESLLDRFEALGRLNDIDEAVECHKAAISFTLDDKVDKPDRLRSLGNALLARFRRSGNFEDLDDAIIQQQAAVDLAPDDNKPGYLYHLGNSLQTRIELLGNLDDVEDAIVQRQRAVDLTPDGDPNKSIYLAELGSSLWTRFRHSGRIADIDDSVAQLQLAVNLTSDEQKKSGYLKDLGIALMLRFDRLGNPADIDQSIVQLQQAVDFTSDRDSKKPKYLSYLGNSLSTRFNRFGNDADIDNAISHQQKAINLTPKDDPDKPMYLTNLGYAFHLRFKRARNIPDINAAIEQQQNARSHEVHDAEMAISQLFIAATSPIGPPDTLFKAATWWTRTASQINHDSLLTAYGCAIDLMPLVAWLGLPIADRHQHLANIGGITRGAAAAAISAEQYEKALDWLEQGRSIVWTQILQLRTPVDELRTINPDLANRLLQVAQLLDRGAQARRSEEVQPSMKEEEVGRQYRALTTEWESIIKEIRSIPDFETFLKSPISSRLLNITQDGPVVVLNIANSRCDALALLPGLDDVVHIPLPNVTSERITELRDQIKDQLYSAGIRMRNTRAAKKLDEETDNQTCRRVLAELWTNLVKPILDSLALFPHPNVLPRIWWCATGPLAFLPIHAAGIYDGESKDSQLVNYAISSYIPTLSTLLDPVRSPVNPSFSLLSVIQPAAPGASSIPNTEKELEYIQQRLVGRDHVILAGSKGTKVRVVKSMERCNWLHLACHGIQRPDEPTEKRITELRDQIKDQLYSAGIRMRNTRAAKKLDEETDNQTCRRVLAELWTNLVKPILDSLALFPHPNVLPRIWWCATGPLAFLPIHAAGIYDGESKDSQLVNYAISSYIPTLSTLLDPVRSPVNPSFSLLSVIQPAAPGASSIPNTEKELEYIQQRLVGRDHVILAGSKGTKVRVVKSMERCNWLHLACHGIQRPDEPTESALLLEDGHLTLDEIIKLDLPQAEFAFLSACQTTTGDESLSEEAVHIAGGMLLAGYRGVVATMWSIQDELAPTVTKEFYGHILQGPSGRT